MKIDFHLSGTLCYDEGVESSGETEFTASVPQGICTQLLEILLQPGYA